MNIVFDINDILPQYTYFLEQKKNIIMDGYFTKIIYSNDHFTMNGVYLNFFISDSKTHTVMNKKNIYFNPYHEKNIDLIKSISMLELNILELYKQTYSSGKSTSEPIPYTKNYKKISNNLAKQLYSGIIKVTNHSNVSSMNQCVIKISGVWENYDEMGITFTYFLI